MTTAANLDLVRSSYRAKQTRTDNYFDPHEALKYRSAWRSRHVPVGLAGAQNRHRLIHSGVVYAPLSPPSTRKVDAVT